MKKRPSNKNNKSKKKSSLTPLKLTAQKEIKNKPFWAFLVIIFLSSFLALTTFTEQHSNLTGNAAIQVISYQQGGTDLFFEIRNVKNLKDATATISETIKNGKITFKEPELRPSFDGTYLSAFTIESSDQSKLQQLKITLKIKESDISASKLLPAEVLVYYNNKPLPTTLSHSKDDYVYYTITTTDLGTFIIGKQKLKLTPQPQETQTSNTITPQPAIEQQPISPVEQQPLPIESPQITSPQPSPTPPTPTPQPTTWEKIKNFFRDIF